MIQYSETPVYSLGAAAYWMPACAGMTAAVVARAETPVNPSLILFAKMAASAGAP